METTVTLTEKELDALQEIRNGGDVYAYGLARDLRSIQRKAPELLEIVDAKQAPKDGAKQQPYFGCIATAKGRNILKATGRKHGQR